MARSSNFLISSNERLFLLDGVFLSCFQKDAVLLCVNSSLPRIIVRIGRYLQELAFGTVEQLAGFHR